MKMKTTHNVNIMIYMVLMLQLHIIIFNGIRLKIYTVVGFFFNLGILSDPMVNHQPLHGSR